MQSEYQKGFIKKKEKIQTTSMKFQIIAFQILILQIILKQQRQE